MRFILFCLLAPIVFALLPSSRAEAQITAPRNMTVKIDEHAKLKERLTNRLHATTLGQQAYINYVVAQVKAKKLEMRLVVAIERYAIRRNSHFPFLFFERALKNEANRRGVSLPSVQQFASSRVPSN